MSWYKNEKFWIDYAPLMFDQDRLARTEEETEDILRLMKVRDTSEILDVCCGQGRYAIELAKKGHKVTGVDITREYLNKAEKDTREKKLDVNYICEDILHYKEENRYDCAINMFTSFGFFDDEEDEIQAVKNVYNSLKEGGHYLIDVNGKEIIARDFEDRIWFESGDIKVFLEQKLHNSFTTLENRWLFFQNGIMREHTFYLRIYSAVELAQLLGSCGFNEVEIYGDFKGAPYDIKAKRLIVVGKK